MKWILGYFFVTVYKQSHYFQRITNICITMITLEKELYFSMMVIEIAAYVMIYDKDKHFYNILYH